MKKSLIGSDELQQFYSNKFYFSYSGINKLLFSPSWFYNHYILKEQEDSVDSHLVQGRVIHCLLLNPEDFDDEFIVMPGKMPGTSNRTIVDEIFKIHLEGSDNSLTLDKYETAIVDLLEKINLHQKLKTDEARVKKILIPDNISYFEFLKSSQGKTLLDNKTLSYCKECVESIKENESIVQLLQLDKRQEDTHLEIYNEEFIKIENKIYTDDKSFGFKGILDNVIIDNDAKTLFINDLKTTGKALIDFPESIEYYRYWLQAAIYYQLAFYKWIRDKEDSTQWKINFTFVVVDKYNQVYPFQVSDGTMRNWLRSLRDDIIPTLEYHYNNKDYTLPYDLAIGNVKL
jgi:hypothetical protein